MLPYIGQNLLLPKSFYFQLHINYNTSQIYKHLIKDVIKRISKIYAIYNLKHILSSI